MQTGDFDDEKHLKNTNLCSIEFLKTKMTSDLWNVNRETSRKVSILCDSASSLTRLNLSVSCRGYQMVPGNDQNTSPTNKETAGSKLKRTSQLKFYGSRKHLKSFSGNVLVLIFLLGCLLTYLMKSLVFNATIFE